MKIYKLLLLTLLSCFAISCSQDTLEEQNLEKQSSDDFNQRHAAGEFDLTFKGIYKGLFTTNDGLTRGTMVLTLGKKNVSSAQITLSSGEIIELEGSGKFSGANITKTVNFSTVGVGAINASFVFSVENDGTLPSISNIMFDSKESNVLVGKDLSRAPLNTLTGTYDRTSGGGNFADSGRTWNIMTIGGGDLTYSTQIFYGGNIYNSTNNGSQDNCVDGGGGSTTCDIDGTATVAGVPVSWTGTHFYDNFDDNLGCSEFSGTWAAPSYGNSVGTFVSDSDCGAIEIVNDTCASASSISLGDSSAGTTTGSTTTSSPGTGECDDNLFFDVGTIENGVWYSYTATADIDVQIDTEGTTDLGLDPTEILSDTQLRVFSGSCGALTCVANDDDDASGFLSLVTFSVTAGETYYIYVGGYSDNVGAFLLNVSEILPPLPFDLDLTCGEFMIDNGLEAANYASSSTDTYSIDAGVGNTISLNFSQFDTENTYDFVRVYDGADDTAPYITMSVGGNTTYAGTGDRFGFTGTGTNSLVGDSVVSTGQFMTVVFFSDGTVTRAGFVAEVVCSMGRTQQGLTKTSLTYNPAVDMSRSIEKQTEINTVILSPGQAKTEAYYLSQQ